MNWEWLSLGGVGRLVFYRDTPNACVTGRCEHSDEDMKRITNHSLAYMKSSYGQDYLTMVLLYLRELLMVVGLLQIGSNSK